MSNNYKNKAYPLRIDNELRMKLAEIAKREDRTLCKQFERITREYIAAYEAEHGEITLSNEP